MTTTVRKMFLLAIIVLVALNVAVVAMWISASTGNSIPLVIRDGGIALGGTLTVGVGLLACWRALT